jgi:hypothetical protein
MLLPSTLPPIHPYYRTYLRSDCVHECLHFIFCGYAPLLQVVFIPRQYDRRVRGEQGGGNHLRRLQICDTRGARIAQPH